MLPLPRQNNSFPYYDSAHDVVVGNDIYGRRTDCVVVGYGTGTISTEWGLEKARHRSEQESPDRRQNLLQSSSNGERSFCVAQRGLWKHQ